MAQVYGVLNALFVKFVDESITTFPEIEKLKKEQEWLQSKMDENPINVHIYDHYKHNLDKISEKIHRKNVSCLLEEDVALVNNLCLKELFSRLLEDEYDIVWQSLQNILKQMGLVQSVGACIPKVADLLKNFQDNNPGIDMRGPGVQALMMKQLLSDPNFGKQAAAMFSDQDENTSILANIPDKLRALGLTTLGVEVEEEETKEEVETKETKEEIETKTISASDIFKKTKRNRQKAKKPIKNVFAEVADMMTNQKLDSPDFTEIRKEINSVFDGTNKDQPDIEKMMEQFTTTGNFSGSGFDPKAMMESMSKNAGFSMNEMIQNLQKSMNQIPPQSQISTSPSLEVLP